MGSPMRRTILRMIATGSLSAFSSAAMPALRAPGVQPARATVEPAAKAAQDLSSAPQTAPPGRPPPRGSLLDLSV
jgi:hypothetical protein